MNSVFKIISFTKHLKKWYIWVGVLVVVISLLSLVGPFLSKLIVDIIVKQISGGKVEFSLFTWLLIAVIVTDVAITILTTISQTLGDILTVKLQTFLSKEFYRHVLDLHMGFYDNQITGNIINKMYRGITSITEFIKNMFNNFLPFFLTALVTIILLAFYSPVIAILLAVLFPIYILISHGSTKQWEKYEGKKNFLNDMSQGRVFESISGIRVVKSFASQFEELASFMGTRKEIEGLSVKQSREWHIYDFFRRFCLNIILFAIYAYIVYWTFYKRFTLGEMTLLLQLVNQARFPLFAMSFILGQIQQASAGSFDFFKVLDTKSKIVDKKDARKLVINKNRKSDALLIEFNNVFFNYEQGKSVLNDITFHVHPKEKVALVGGSGQGKSTIVNLLLRYYEPQKGEICIDGQNIAGVTQNSLHENIAVVFQDTLLFSGTILENIKYGKLAASMDEVVAAARAANAHEFIEELPNGYESVVGERGVKLSGGQKQRVAIARAILKNAPIIILDEATSSLDSRSELEVQKGLDTLLKDRTSVIIAHRLSTIANANQIIVISKGSILQHGTPQELMEQKDGMYSKLIRLQRELLEVPSEERNKRLQEFDLVG